jgi:dTDP-4-dehydrorhamnose reductase
VFRVLVLGAGGMLAHDVLAEAPRDAELAPRTSREVDVTSQEAVNAAVAEATPNVVINCAAYTDVDGAESHRDQAFAVNGDAPGFIAAALARSGALLIHYGTDYVFDGSGSRPYREEDTCAPIGVYGASKLAGEESIGRQGGRSIVLRTQWLYGLHGRSFPRTMWERATARLPTKVVNDQTGCPTYTVDLARATWRLVAVERRHAAEGTSAAARPPILHVANGGSATWYQVARHVFERAGAAELLTPCPSSDFPRPAKRPAWSVLDTARFERLAGQPLPKWDDALDRFLDQLGEHAT